MLSRPKVKEFFASLPADQTLLELFPDQMMGITCPLSLWLITHGYPGASVGTTLYYDGTRADRELPKWAIRFVSRIDDLGRWRDLTPRKILGILARE